MQIQQSTITLKGLKFYAHHGVMEQERKVGAHFCVDLTLHLGDVSAAIMNDELSATVNYAEVYDVAKVVMAEPSALLEHVAGRMARALLSRFHLIESLEVSITKCNPPMGADCDGAAFTLKAKK